VWVAGNGHKLLHYCGSSPSGKPVPAMRPGPSLWSPIRPGECRAGVRICIPISSVSLKR